MASESAPKKKKSLFRRIMKWTGITFLLLLITAFILPFIFKDKIIQFAKDEMNNNLNATVTFGNFDLSLISSFPSFRFTISDLKVIGKDEFAKDTLANIPLLKLDLDLMSVIKGDQYKVNSILLDHPRILAKVLANGKANWDITKPSAPTKDAAPEAPTKFKASLKNLDILDGYIVYDDASLAFKSILDDFTYNLSGDFTQDNFLMKNKMQIARLTVGYGGMNYLSKVKTDAKADLDMDMVNWKFTFKDNEFNLNELAFGLDGFFAMPGSDYNMDLKFKAKQSEFKSFLSLIPGAYTKDFSTVKASGKLSFDGFLKGVYSEKQNTMPGYGLNFQIADGMVQYPSVPKPISAINIDCKIDDASGITDQTKIDVNKFHIDFGGNPVDATLHVSTPVSDANMNGAIKCALDLATLKNVMPLKQGDELNGKINADVKINGRMSQIEKSQYDQFQCSGTVGILNMMYKTKSVGYDMNIADMDLNFTPQFISLTKFDAKLGKNDVKADGRIDNLMTYLFKDSLLRGTFNMNSNLMDLNQFMGDASTTTTAPVDSSAATVLQIPGNIDFTLKSTIGKLIYQDINMDNVSGVVALRNKTIDISNLAMNLMGGKMNMSGKYSTADPMVPKVDLKVDISDFDIQQSFKTFPTVAKMVPIAQYAKGKYSTKINYSSNLDQKMMPVITSVNGQGTLSTKQVEVDGFAPLKKLDETLKIKKFEKVTLQDLNLVSFKIENGRVSTDPFDFKVGKSSGQVGGSTGIDQSINYVMNVAIPRDEFGPANTALNTMVSGATAKTGIPVKLGDVVNVQALFGGTVTNPTVKTNLKEAGGNIADQIKNQVKDTLTNIVKNQITNTVNQACKDAQDKLNQVVAQAAITKKQAYDLADQALKATNTNADNLEKSSNNPIQKIANKKAADLMRQKGIDANKKAKSDADQAETSSIKKAQDEKDAKCK